MGTSVTAGALGGLGIRSAALLAPSAYLASAAGATNLILNLLPHRLHSTSDVSVDMALSAWREQVESTTSPPVTDQRSHQKAWDTPCCEWKAAALLAGAPDETSRARLLASVQDTSGSWLSAVPISSLGLKLGDDAVRIAAGLRLGVNLCEPHVCVCGTQVDARGIHGLACKKSAGRHPRHSELNDIICRALQRAQIPSTKEPVGLSRSDGKRPDGLTLIPWERGRCLAWDVTVPDTFAPSHVPDSSRRAGSAASKAEASKSSKYVAIGQTHCFVPLALETLGAWGEHCKVFVRELGRRVSSVTGDPREWLFLKQRLSIAIQRGNAIACRGTLRAVLEQYN